MANAPRENGNEIRYDGYCAYILDKDKVAGLRPAHRQYMAQLDQNGKLLCAGPFRLDFKRRSMTIRNSREPSTS